MSGTKEDEPSHVSYKDSRNLKRRKLSHILDTRVTNSLESTIVENVREEKADGKGVGGSNYPFDLFFLLPCNLSNYFIR